MKSNFFLKLEKQLIKENIIIYANLYQKNYDIKFISDQLYKFFLKNDNFTFIIPCFTNIYAFNNGKIDFFHKRKKSNLGYFSNYLLKKKKIYRSSHPTNSYIFIGKNALKYSRIQHYNSSPHKIFETIGFDKIVTLGINYKGSVSYHVAEYQNKISKRNIGKFFLGAYYKKNNNILWFKSKHVHGCSLKHLKNFDKFYVLKGVVKIIKLKKLRIFFTDFRSILEIENKLLKKNIKYFLCKNSECIFCNGLSYIDLKKIIFFYIVNFKKLLNFLITNKKKSLNLDMNL